MTNASIRANAQAMPIDRRAALTALVAAGALLVAPKAAKPEESGAKNILTNEQLAAMPFEPWQHSDGEWTPFGDEHASDLDNPYLPTLRLAWLTVHKSKSELEEVFCNLADDDFIGLVERLSAAAEYSRFAQRLFESAEARVMIAAASAMVKDDAANSEASSC